MQEETYFHKLKTLFTTFLKIGAFTFGGGYAMIPLIQKETVETHHWVSEEDILDILAITESTPGVLAVNSATFIGYKVAGFWGSLIATIGVVVPSFVIIALLSFAINEFKDNQRVAYAFSGIRCGVVLLMINATRKLLQHCDKNKFSVLLMVISFFMAAFIGFEPVLLLICGGILGVIYQTIVLRKGKDDVIS